MIFAQVKLFHSSGLMWNCALTKHCCQSARGPLIGSHGSISTPSNHGSVYSGYSIRCTFAAPHQHNEKQRKSFVFVGSWEAVSQSGRKWKHDCQRRPGKHATSLSNCYLQLYQIFTLTCFSAKDQITLSCNISST